MTDSKNGLWSEPCYVYTHDVDPGGKMSFAAIARYFQEAAWHSAEALGFGYEEATRLKQFWVLVRQSIKAHRLPVWGEHLVIETWPRGVDGLWAFRDYNIRDQKGSVCIGATSSWMIMDANSHRPLKPEIVSGAMPWVIETKAIGETASKIVHEGSWEIVDQRKVRFSDMDINGHMNNSRYVEWIADAIRLQNEKGGLIPTSSWYRKKYGIPWQAGESLSIAIGQGSNLLVSDAGIDTSRETDCAAPLVAIRPRFKVDWLQLEVMVQLR